MTASRTGPREYGPCLARWIGFVICAAFMARATAGVVYPGGTAPEGAIEQRLGAQLPLELSFHAADGRPVRLGDFFARADDARRVPVVLVLGYYRCPRLCETVMEGTLEALAQSGAPRSSYRVVAVSIDPAETLGRRQRSPATGRRLCRPAPPTALARPCASRAARPAGADRRRFGHRPARATGRLRLRASRHRGGADDAASSVDHATGFVVVTPDGRVSRYFLGVRHDPLALAGALATRAAAPSAAWSSGSSCCAPTSIRRSAATARAVLPALRLSGIALALALALLDLAPARARSRAPAMNDTAAAGPARSAAHRPQAGISDPLFLVLLGLLRRRRAGAGRPGRCSSPSRYRARLAASTAAMPPSNAPRLELAWTITPLLVFVAHLRLGGARVRRACTTFRPTRCRSTSSASNGCGRLQHAQRPARDQRAARAARPAGASW